MTVLFAGICASAIASDFTLQRLQCEYMVRPLGIDAVQPRFTWQMATPNQPAKQVAFVIRLAADSTTLASQPSFTSEKIQSGQQLFTYNGPTLKPFTKYYWQVQTWDQDGHTHIATSSFETGMVNKNNWKGAWIADRLDIHAKPAPLFRRAFQANKPIKQARAYIAAGGLYELYINGQKISSHQLDPMYTRFDRRTLYVTHDVTTALQQGKNAVGVMLGNGWYNHQSTAVWDFHKAPWRARPTFCMDLRITYTDGTEETIATDRDWRTSLSPVVFNSIYTAEHIDARKIQNGWNTANFDDSKWGGIIYRAAPSMNIVSQVMHPIERVETILPVSMRKINDRQYIFDLGRNISGVSEITLKGDAGTEIRVRHSELLDSAGNIDMSNIDVHYRPTDDKDPFQVDIYTLAGIGTETFSPHFNYKGFQYIEVTSSTPIALTKESVVAYFMHSKVPPIGVISTSQSTLQKLWWATNNAYLSNLFGYPTDCPQREKNGWTGDAHIAVETGLYNFDAITVYEKWLADHRDEQQPNGVLPSIIPTGGWGYEWGNGPDWTSTIAIIPWQVYMFYGDTTLLSRSYEAMKAYVNHITDISPDGITTWGLGDWVPVKSTTPVPFTSTAYYFADATIVAKAAKILGKTGDYIQYSKLANTIKNAFNEKYLDRLNATYGKGQQTEMSVPLYWGLVPNELKSVVAANLAKRVAQDNYHLDVGLLGTKAILNALTENGYDDVAYKVASQKTFPSWGYWVENGATTLWENWPLKAKSDISRNHIMFGEIGAWLYKGIAGIYPDENQAGFKHILLKPYFPADLNDFAVSHEGPYGQISTLFQRNKKVITYQVTIPPNSSATLTFKGIFKSVQMKVDGKLTPVSTQDIALSAGTYQFELK